MKTCCSERCVKKPLLLLLTVGLALVPGGQMMGQTFNVLYSSEGTNGANPQGVIASGNTVYGTANRGGSTGNGTVFKIRIDGTGFEVLHHFVGGTNDGAVPFAGLILSGNTLYGTTFYGGNSGAGIVFAISTDGTSFTNLHSFSGSDGRYPHAPVVLQSNRLYGTTEYGGLLDRGTVFGLNLDGTGFTLLHSFAGIDVQAQTNKDGARPQAGLAISGNMLYGTTIQGGTSGYGTIFAVSTNGTDFTNLHSFTQNDGSDPVGGVSLSGKTLYGTTANGGGWGNGTVFALNTDGTGFRLLYSFDQFHQLLGPPYSTFNIGGASPNYLILSGNKLYGTAYTGGYWNFGTVFELNTDGSGFQALYNFGATNTDGRYPNGLNLSGSTLYGTTEVGGIWANGTIFSLSLQLPQLAIVRSGTDLLLSWPTDYVGYTLQATTNLASQVWTTNLPAPVVVNGEYMVTIPISGTRQFFRLTQ